MRASARSRMWRAPAPASRPSRRAFRRSGARIAQREHRLAVLIGDAARRTAGRPVAAAVSGTREGARDRRAGHAAPPPARRPIRGAPARGVPPLAKGVAAADLYPRITVTGFLGLLAGRGNLFNVADTRAWAVTPALSWAAFDLGSARARLRGAEGGTAGVARGVRTGRAARARGD